jgi:hypothetical protein
MVGQIEIYFEPSVLIYFDSLAFELYKKEYFSFIESANNYVDYIYNEIIKNIQFQKHHDTVSTHKKYGAHYIIIKTNNRTAWHVYFNKKGNKYIITKILNNHLPTAKFLNDL